MKTKTVTQSLIRGLVQGLCAFLFLFCFQQIKAVDYEVVSPNGELKIKLHINGSTQYEILQGETSLIGISTIALNLHSGLVVGAGTVKSTETNSVNTTLPVLIGKNKTLDEKYNERIIYFNENYDLIVRAYNEGIAYRWKTGLAGNIIIDDERLEYNFSGSPTTYFPEADNLEHWEKSYTVNTANKFSASRYAVTPVLFSWPNSSHKIVIAEADLYDYPGLYIQATGNDAMKGMWAKYPETVEEPDNIYSNHKPLTRYNYIATTTGTRTFPWRVFAVSNDDKSLLNNELVYLLAEPQRLTNTDWIVPGKTTWEWWHKAMLDPSVDPKVPAYGNANLGFDLYKYYVDFAAKNNIQYLTLDAGWSETYIQRLCNYARGKGVKIIVWTWASVPLEEAGWVAKQKRNGVSGAKIDFFNRNDQIAMTWGHRIAQELADSEMIGIFHGCPVPTGLNRTFPNILNFEAILGNEENFWRRGCSPDYHVQFPFIRSLAGPEDFTPGSMRNKTRLLFSPVDQDNVVPSSQGTRAHELSMYIIFDQWLGFLCDAPTEYMKYPDILDFLAHVPTVWDKTVPLDAQLGEYIVMAKQNGKDWYVGGMSSWDAHDVNVDFSFLSPGISYQAAILKDGQNASNYPTRYAGDTITVTSESQLALNMAKGGGFVIRLTEVEETGETDIKDLPVKSASSLSVDKTSAMLHIYADKAIQTVDIYNINGQKMLNIPENRGVRQAISLLNWPKGVYITKIQTETGLYTLKFMY